MSIETILYEVMTSFQSSLRIDPEEVLSGDYFFARSAQREMRLFPNLYSVALMDLIM